MTLSVGSWRKNESNEGWVGARDISNFLEINFGWEMRYFT